MENKKDKLVFWNIWSSYATYYFGKVNLSIVVPALLVTYNPHSGKVFGKPLFLGGFR